MQGILTNIIFPLPTILESNDFKFIFVSEKVEVQSIW